MFPNNHSYGFNTNNLELYPRKRATEFYYEPQPLEEYQSRLSEHAYDKLENRNNVKTVRQFPVKNLRISPPTNSEMRIYRNSYFS